MIKEKRKEKENIDYGERKDRLQRKELKITEKGKRKKRYITEKEKIDYRERN